MVKADEHWQFVSPMSSSALQNLSQRPPVWELQRPRGSGLVSCRTAVNTLKSFGCGRLTVIVVDASVALAWVLPDTEQNVACSARVADARISGRDELVAPQLLTTECSCRLLK